MKKQLECWYAKHPPSNKRFLPKDDANRMEFPMESISQYTGFMMMMIC